MAKVSQIVRQQRTPKFKTRGYTRCRRCGRARAVYRKFGVCRICLLERVSRPGERTYVDHAHIPRIQGGMGTAIISTSRGLMTGHDARNAGIGGEVLARVW